MLTSATDNGSVKLSAAAKTIYPVMPPGAWKRNALFAPSATALTGIADPWGSVFPIVRFDN